MKTRPITLITSTRAPFLASTMRRAAARACPRIVERAQQRGARSMKTSASRWSQEWLPSVTTSAPASMSSSIDRLGDAEAAGGVLAVDDDADRASSRA